MKYQKHQQIRVNQSISTASAQQIVRKQSSQQRQQRSRSITSHANRHHLGNRAQSNRPAATDKMGSWQKQNQSQLMLRNNSGTGRVDASGNINSSFHIPKSAKFKNQNSVNMDHSRKLSSAAILGSQSQNTLGSAMSHLRKQSSIHGGNDQHQVIRPQILAKNGGKNTGQTRSQAKAISSAITSNTHTTADRKSKSPSKNLKQKYQSATSKIPPRVQRPQTAKAQHNPGSQIRNKLGMHCHQNSISNQFFKDATSRNQQSVTQVLT